MNDDRYDINIVPLASVSLISNLLMTLVQSGKISREECIAIFDKSIEQQRGAPSQSNREAASFLIEMKQAHEAALADHQAKE